jgi:hypothetical protein
MSEKTENIETNEELEELKLEATSLGIKFNQNIGLDKLQAKVDEYYENESKANSTPVQVKPEAETEDKPGKVDPKPAALAKIAEQKRLGREPVVVNLTMVDKREASTATDAYFSNGEMSMRVPLDTWVEMPRYLVDQAEKAKALIHQETPQGTISKYTKKYVVEYKDGK